MTYTVPPGRYSAPGSIFIQQYIDEAIADLIDSAPESLNTLKEFAEALENNPDAFTDLNSSITNEIARATAAESALGTDINDEEIARAAAVTVVTTAVQTEQARAESAEAAEVAARQAAVDTVTAALNASVADELASRDALEAEDVRLQNAIDTEIAERLAGDTGENDADILLSARLDVLEADPVTKTESVAADAIAVTAAASYTDQQINDLVNGASGALDTLKELGDALTDNDSEIAALVTQISTNESALTQEVADRAAGDTALQANLNTEEAARIAADAALLEEMFPPECTTRKITANLVSVDSAGGNTPVGGSTYTDTEFGWEDSATWTHYLWISNNLRGSGDDRFPYGDGTLPPQSKITINDVRYDVTEYKNVSGYSYFEVTADLSSLVGTEITIDYCIPQVYAKIENPDFEGQVDIDTNARIEFADNLTKIHNVLRGTSINIGNNIELKPAAAGGRVEVTGDLVLDASDLTDAADDTAAASAGVIVGQIYHNSGVLRIRLS